MYVHVCVWLSKTTVQVVLVIMCQLKMQAFWSMTCPPTSGPDVARQPNCRAMTRFNRKGTFSQGHGWQGTPAIGLGYVLLNSADLSWYPLSSSSAGGGQPVSQAFPPLQVEILPQGRESPIFKQFFKDWK